MKLTEAQHVQLYKLLVEKNLNFIAGVNTVAPVRNEAGKKQRVLDPLKFLDSEDMGRINSTMFKCDECSMWWGTAQQDPDEAGLCFQCSPYIRPLTDAEILTLRDHLLGLPDNEAYKNQRERYPDSYISLVEVISKLFDDIVPRENDEEDEECIREGDLEKIQKLVGECSRCHTWFPAGMELSSDPRRDNKEICESCLESWNLNSEMENDEEEEEEDEDEY